MTTLKLAIDASGARQGAAEFERATQQVSQSAQKAGNAVDIYFGPQSNISKGLEDSTTKARNFGRTVEAVGEVTQVTGRIKLLGEEVRNLGSGMGSAASVGNLLAGSLVDIAQISGKVEGGFGGFVNLLKANPLLLAATVIGGIATAMSLFGSETADANEELKKQIELQDQLRKASVDFALQLQRNADLQRIGFPVDQREQELLRARRLAEVASGLAGQQGFQTFADLTALTGLSQSELTGLAGRGGIQQQEGQRFESNVQGTRIVMTDVGVTNEAAREIILRVAQIFRNQAVFSPNPTAPVQGVVQAGQAGVSNGGYGFGGFGVLQPGQIATLRDRLNPPNLASDYSVVSQEQIFSVIAKRRDDEIRKLTEQLNQLKSLGQDVGSAIGSAFFSIVNGAANARQALAGLLQQFVAIAQQRAIQGIANSLGNAFGASTAQQISNVQSGGVNVPAQPGGGLAGGGIG
jgi:hypothetical protein